MVASKSVNKYLTKHPRWTKQERKRFRPRWVGFQKYLRLVKACYVRMNVLGFEKLQNRGLVQQECGAAGCLAGWQKTYPPFNTWLVRNGYKTSADGHVVYKRSGTGKGMLTVLAEYFGVSSYNSSYILGNFNGHGIYIYDPKRFKVLTDKQEAAVRVAHVIRYF